MDIKKIEFTKSNDKCCPSQFIFSPRTRIHIAKLCVQKCNLNNSYFTNKTYLIKHIFENDQIFKNCL